MSDLEHDLIIEAMERDWKRFKWAFVVLLSSSLIAPAIAIAF